MARILDKGFKYVPAIDSDIRKTFDRIRREQKKEREAQTHKVTQILRKRA